MPTIQELKDYLGIDGGQSDAMLADFLNMARGMVENILRYQVAMLNPVPGEVKGAIMQAVDYLYSHRGSADNRFLEKSLMVLLEPLRKKEF